MGDEAPAIDYSLVGDDHVRRYQETDGQVGGIWNGAPTLILTTTGARSGEQRSAPLICGQVDDSFIVVASVGGAPKHPGWYHNLMADPNAHVQYLGDKFAARARVAEGAERDQLWNLMRGIWPSYDTYAQRTERHIPVVVLERA